MTYIAVRRDALEEIISDRQLQSTDFEKGKILIDSLLSNQSHKFNQRLEIIKGGHGSIAIGNVVGDDHYFIFDYDQIVAKGIDFQSPTLLMILQKLLRFSIRYWQNGVLRPSEVINSAAGRGIVFPFPISQQTQLRVVIDLAPDSDRMAKRGRTGRYLLAYKITDNDGGPVEDLSLSYFRKFLEDVDALRCDAKTAAPEADSDSLISSFAGFSVDEIESKIDPHQQFETWLHLLTNDQKDFVTKPLQAPRRIDGPAGSGKTVSLALSAVCALREAKRQGTDFDGIFMTHSEASRRSTETILQSMDGSFDYTGRSGAQRFAVKTLQGYCAEILHQDLSTTEFVDQDAYDAKQLQTMYIEESIKSVGPEIEKYRRFLSPDFLDYFENEDIELKAALIQHEIAVVIKGRSRENFDIYKRVPALSSGLPIKNDADKGFLWRIYESYRHQLISGGQFDTDDVVLTALSQLTTPIWRRRRVRDGFDAVFIDETHLFNMNELSIFHHITKSDREFPIAFAVDRSQAVGDRGWVDDIDVSSFIPESKADRINLRSIFRSSPDIVNLAFAITSAGASLFTNFDDPLAKAHSGMSYREERRSKRPYYREVANDADMIVTAFREAEEMREEMSSGRGDIAIIASDELLFGELTKYASDQGKPHEILKQRGDDELAARARNSSRFVLSMPDYVGGLEFDGVVILGVDDGRMPPVRASHRAESKAFVNYAAHNRLYVAISRARYRVAMLGSKERGSSPILTSAFSSGALEDLR